VQPTRFKTNHAKSLKCFEDWDFDIEYCLAFGISSLEFITPPNIEPLRGAYNGWRSCRHSINCDDSEPTITGTPVDYTLTYVPSTVFNYGQELNVTIAAHDLAISP
jgi:hypothetical protein